MSKIKNIMKPLKVKYNRYIPFKGYVAITLFNTIFIREEFKSDHVNKITYNHESIHQVQAYDFGIGFCGYIIFYLLYLLEWILKLPTALFGYKPYRSISFEQECFKYQTDFNYLKNRKRFNWVKYIFKLVK